jgi:hypothetical protein
LRQSGQRYDLAQTINRLKIQLICCEGKLIACIGLYWMHGDLAIQPCFGATRPYEDRYEAGSFL